MASVCVCVCGGGGGGGGATGRKEEVPYVLRANTGKMLKCNKP